MIESTNINTQKIASLISKALHPYVIFSIAVAVITYNANPEPANWVGLTGICLLSAFLMPLSYMQLKSVMVLRTTGTHISTRSFFREQPKEMLTLAILFGVPSSLLVLIMGFPIDLTAIVISAGITSVLIALINCFYRASFHLGLFTSIVVPFTVILSTSWLIMLPSILLLGLSRYHLHEHTPVQMLTGSLIGISVGLAIINGCGAI